MTRISTPPIDDLPAAVRARLEGAESLMGFLPNDALVMARHPALLDAFAALVGAVYGPGRVAPELKRLVGLVTSSAAGCRYCQAHAAYGAQRLGVSPDKLADVWQFSTSPHFTAAERAALEVALRGGQSPADVDAPAFAALAKHFDADEIVEITAVIGLFGFLNRWNQVLDTDLEAAPARALPNRR
ncbi:MAG: carboxymuconolactone decarboxylase family protein [Pseudomonadota bacterium]